MTVAASAPPDCWPTTDQTLLLRAALLDGEIAMRAFEQWRAGVDVHRLDRGSVRLLPLLHRRMGAAAGSHDPLSLRIRDDYERTAVRNAALLDETAGAVRVLRAAGIRSAMLKGMALVARGIVGPGARPMADCDLLVPEAQALEARDVLLRAGWQLRGPMDAFLLPVRHAAGFTGPTGHQLDLHWHVLAECCEPGADDEFWEAVEPAAARDEATATLSPSDMLLQTCVHGLRWSIVPPVRWVADAHAILGSSPIDWERVVEQSERRVLVLPMAATLRYLQEMLDVAVPDWVPARLSRTRPPRWAIAEYRVKMRRRSASRQALFHWLQHRRLGRGRERGLPGDVLSFPMYLLRRWRPSIGRRAGDRRPAPSAR